MSNLWFRDMVLAVLGNVAVGASPPNRSIQIDVAGSLGGFGTWLGQSTGEMIATARTNGDPILVLNPFSAAPTVPIGVFNGSGGLSGGTADYVFQGSGQGNGHGIGSPVLLEVRMDINTGYNLLLTDSNSDLAQGVLSIFAAPSGGLYLSGTIDGWTTDAEIFLGRTEGAAGGIRFQPSINANLVFNVTGTGAVLPTIPGATNFGSSAASFGNAFFNSNVLTGAAPTTAAAQVSIGGTVAATASAGAGTLPLTPEGFLVINVAGTVMKVPYYPT